MTAAEQERAAIVAWFRGERGKWPGIDPHTAQCLANAIERGDHLALTHHGEGR